MLFGDQDDAEPPMAKAHEARGGVLEETSEHAHSMSSEVAVRKILSCYQICGGSSGSSSPWDRRGPAGRL